MLARSRKAKEIGDKPYYKYYTQGLVIKLIGGIIFCLIYAYYYNGGDTFNYFLGVDAMMSVFKNNPFNYISLLFSGDRHYNRNLFYEVNNFPPIYMFKDTRTFTVIKISSVFAIPGMGGFLATTILLSSFIYNWVWKLYSFLIERYPSSYKSINIAVLYLPSTVFWGSGIMKDTFAFGATCYAVYGLYQFFIKRKRKLLTITQLAFCFYLIITIKAYIMFALLPGLLVFANFERIKRIKSTFVKIIILPLSIGLIFFIANTLFLDFDDLFGKYSADKLLEEAVVQNNDLKRDVYGSNSFDIGEFEPTLQGALSKFFPAIGAALYRPYLWESGSPTMLFSGLENLLLAFFTIWTLLTRPLKLLGSIRGDPFLIFCLLFTIILGFGVGLSTSNFGALVRYKIPFLPFFVFLVCQQLSFLKSEESLVIEKDE